MTEGMIVAICGAIVCLGLFGLVAFRLWLDYKLELLEWEDEQ